MDVLKRGIALDDYRKRLELCRGYICRYNYLLRMSVAFLYLVGICCMVLLPLAEKRKVLREELAVTGRKVAELESFSRRYSDYEKVLLRMQEEAVQKGGELYQTSEERLHKLAELAASCRLTLLQAKMDVGGKESMALAKGFPKRKKAEDKLQMVAAGLRLQGDFHDLLRWLRKIEREGVQVEKLSLGNQEQDGELLAEITLAFYQLPLAEKPL